MIERGLANVSVPYPQPEVYRFPRLFATAALTVWLAFEPCQGQSRDIAFGLIRRIRVPELFERTRQFRDAKSNEQQILLWSSQQSHCFLGAIDSSLDRVSTKKVELSKPFDDLLAGDFTNDGVADLVVVRNSEQSVSVMTGLRYDEISEAFTLQLEFQPSEIVISDFNNDKRLDFLIVDRNNPGIISFSGNGKGAFTRGKTIAPDNAVAAVSVTHLNNDRLIDLVFYDWVKSELHLLYGVGRGRFVDQTVFPVDGEMKKLVVVEKGRAGSVDFLLEMKAPGGIQFWEGDGLGDFHKKATVSVSQPVTDIAGEDVNNDGLKDLVILHSGNLEVYFNSSENPFEEHAVFATPMAAKDVLLSDFNRDNRVDALMLEDQNVLVYCNAAQPYVLKDSVELVTGVQPAGFWVGDINGDRHTDVGLLNEGSSTFSVFYGTSRADLAGQSMFTVPAKPRMLDFHSSTDTSTRFIISYPGSLSFFSLQWKNNSSVNAVIPSDVVSEVLAAGRDLKANPEFFCMQTRDSTEHASVSYYQRIGVQTFLERNYRLSDPDTLLGAAVADVNRDSVNDLVYVYRSTDLKNLELGLALLDTSLEVKQRVTARELFPANDRTCFVWASNLDNDDTLDVLLVFPGESRKMYALRGKSEDLFEDAKLLDESVRFTGRSQLRIIDADGDGLQDIVYVDDESMSLVWLKNKGGMSFEPRQKLVSTRAGSHFSLGHLNRDGVMDIAVTDQLKGSLKLYNGTLFWKPHAARK